MTIQENIQNYMEQMRKQEAHRPHLNIGEVDDNLFKLERLIEMM